MKKITTILTCMLFFIIFFSLNNISFSSFKDEIEEIENKIIDESKMEPECLEPNAEHRSKNESNTTNSKGKGLNLLGKYNGLTYYSQADKRWAKKLYTSTNNPTQTMKSSGCGPTAAAIVVSSSKGNILPITMANLFVKNGYRTANNGTSWSAFPFIANYFDFNNYKYTTNLNTAIDYLRRGYYIIASCGNGLFTTNGHYIVLVTINGNTLSIYDTYMYDGKFDLPSRKGKITISGNTIYCTIDTFQKFANYRAFWCYSNDKGHNSTNIGSSDEMKYTAGTYQITASVLRVRSGPGTNYKIITRIYKGSKEKIDIINKNWGHLSNNRGWVCLDYCNKIASSDNPPKNYSAGTYKVATKSLPLRVRNKPGTNSRVIGRLNRGSIVKIDYTDRNWGHLSNNMGWIYLGYCNKITNINNPSKNYSVGTYRVVTKSLPLRIRNKPGINSKVVGKLNRGSIIKINYTDKNWGRLSNNKGWICLDYCKKER